MTCWSIGLASPNYIPSNNAASILVVLSSSISNLHTVSTPSHPSLTSSDFLASINITGVTTREQSFNLRGSNAESSTSSVPTTAKSTHSGDNDSIVPPGVKGLVSVTKVSSPSSKPGKDSKETTRSAGGEDPGHIHSLGITIKKGQEDFGGWYKQVLTYGDMLDYYDVSGCYILKPASYGVWEMIQREFG